MNQTVITNEEYSELIKRIESLESMIKHVIDSAIFEKDHLEIVGQAITEPEEVVSSLQATIGELYYQILNAPSLIVSKELQKYQEYLKKRVKYVESNEANSKRDKVTKMLSASDLKPKEKEIIVPDSIVFEEDCGQGDDLGIVFNQGKQNLYYWANGVYSVCDAVETITGSNFKLIKIDPKDREVGHTYYLSYDGEMCTDKQRYYCKYLGNSKFAWIEECTDVMVGGDEDRCFTWYKVVRI